MEKIAFVTQSYKPDFDVCKLLCKSIDRFSPNVDHYIFVNDEDVKLFKSLQYKNHYVLGKSTILPWFFIRFPFKIAGHIFYLSPFTSSSNYLLFLEFARIVFNFSRSCNVFSVPI